MRKINFKGLTTKAAGLAAGTAAAGIVQKGVDKLGLTGMMSDLAVIAVGAVGPDLLGKKDPLFEHAGTAIMVKGINGILKRQFPSLISGTEDDYDVSGAEEGDYEVGDAESFNDVEVAGIIAGPDFDESNVAGPGFGVGSSSAL